MTPRATCCTAASVRIYTPGTAADDLPLGELWSCYHLMASAISHWPVSGMKCMRGQIPCKTTASHAECNGTAA